MKRADCPYHAQDSGQGRGHVDSILKFRVPLKNR